jgi:putative DNA primase/helicase
VRQATDEYREEQDSVRQFVADCCTVGPGLMYMAKAMYDAYVKWSGDTLTSLPQFTARMENLSYTRQRKSSGCFWNGITYTG